MDRFSKYALTLALLYGVAFIITEYRICSYESCYIYNDYGENTWHIHQQFPFQDGHYHLASISNGSDDLPFDFVDVQQGRMHFDGTETFGITYPILGQPFHIGPSCFYYEMQISPFDDSHFYVFGTEADPPARSIAELCTGDCCNRQTEYFDYFEEAVDLPVHTDNPVLPPAPQLCIPLFLPGEAEYSMNAAADRSLDCEALALRVEQQLLKVPDRMQQQLFIGLYADRTCTLAAIQEMESLIRECGFDRYFRYTRSASTGPDFEVAGYWVTTGPDQFKANYPSTAKCPGREAAPGLMADLY